MTNVGVELRTRCDAGGRWPKRSAYPRSRNVSVWHLTTACAALEICLESVFIGSVLRCATDLRLALAKALRWGIDGEGFGKDWGRSREGAVDLRIKRG
jgi:hypothetical protein